MDKYVHPPSLPLPPGNCTSTLEDESELGDKGVVGKGVGAEGTAYAMA